MMLCKKLVVICSVCWRARYEDAGTEHHRDRWQELDALITEEHLNGDDYALSHGYCPTCVEAFLQELHARQVTAGQSYGSVPRHAVQ
ncbi:MAG TPA: hypothetical protein VFG71_06425 [Nitrospiraceae bacterium]|nr:hypothetical protein [Nitrospiraceae bacterium]